MGIEPEGPLLCESHATLYGASFTCAIQAQGLKKIASTAKATHKFHINLVRNNMRNTTHNPQTKFPFRIPN
jgi:hypothetical protein